MDYEEAVDEKYMELLEEFIELHKRQPRYEEIPRLYDLAKELVEDRMCDRADEMRKREKGE
jgi:Mn-dependent DtxR family transcriptional regulator